MEGFGLTETQKHKKAYIGQIRLNSLLNGYNCKLSTPMLASIKLSHFMGIRHLIDTTFIQCWKQCFCQTGLANLEIDWP